MSEPASRPAVVPMIWCARPRDHIAWLQSALGFEASMIVAGDDDVSVIHAELTYAGGSVYVTGPPDQRHGGDFGGVTPSQAGGGNTQSICMNLTGELDAHCERARAAGATIIREPADQPYGDRSYGLVDPEGHFWFFGQPAKVMTVDEMAAATGRRIEAPNG